MNRRDPSLVSIVIATFNSAAKLPRTLDKLTAQVLPPGCKLEILVADGGSSDDTRSIAQRFGAHIIDNPRTVPGWAKFLGLHASRGRIVVFLDSDEVYAETCALSNMIAAFRENPEVHMVTTSGYRCPDGYPFINLYINEFGDPFSFFIYRLSKDHRFYLPTMRRRYQTVSDTDRYAVFDLSAARDYPLIEMYAMGAALDVEYFANEFPAQFHSEAEFSHAFNYFLSHSPRVAIAKHSDLYHYSADSLKGFVSKVNWRIRSNIFFANLAAAGFSGRYKFQGRRTRLRKYAFLPYNLLILPLLLDTFYLTLSRRNPIYLWHFFLSLSTAFTILVYYALFLCGWRPVVRAYGSANPAQSPR